MKFFDNVSGGWKVFLILVVILIVVRIVAPDVAEWALNGIREMVTSLRELGG